MSTVKSVRRTAKPKQKRQTLTDNRRCSVEKKRHGTRSRHKRKPLTVGTTFAREPRDHSSTTQSSHRVTAYEAFIQDVSELGVRGIRQEFVSDVRDYEPPGTTIEGETPSNLEKNRYDNVPLLDKTRVRIRGSDDYIHASMVHVEGGVDFICTQGPMENTVEQFWIMIFQQGSREIVQLCALMEEGKEKCFEYFSPTTDDTKSFGSIKVQTVLKLPKIASLKKVSRTRLTVSYNGSSSTVVHILYAGWPDHFVPDSVTVCSELLTLVMRSHDGKPIVVHCSAGIGRTGAFVAAQMALQRLKMKEQLEVRDLVKHLRDQRHGCVQNDRQYLLIYRLVLESLITEGKLTKDQRVIDFFNEYEDLISRKRAEAARKGGS